MNNERPPEFVHNLTDDELRIELAKNGEKVGPITPTTRRLYKSRLLRKLTAVQNTGKVKVTPETVSNKTTQTQDEFMNVISSQTDTKCLSTPTKKLQQCRPRKLLENSPGANSSEHNTSPGLMDSDSGGHAIESGQCESNADTLCYGIHIPIEEPGANQHEPIVFESKEVALLALKKHKNARFKEFHSTEKAKEFSLIGSEIIGTEKPTTSTESDDSLNKYPTLKQQDLNKLARFIESGELPNLLSLIWSNPKYLISSADGPVSLKPSVRYNALHIAAKSNQPEICRELLLLLQNSDFQSLLFSNTDDPNVSKYRTHHLIDSYLNTPDKILFETPLHFASKAGHKDVVRELVMYDSCSTSMLNKSNKTPLDVVCSRATGIMSQNRHEIEQLITKRYYVPLLRYHDNSEHAVIGEPIKSREECEQESSSTAYSKLSVRAFAGPMLKKEADDFRLKWTTPSKQKHLKEKFQFVRRCDFDKGDEQIGRELASQNNFGWTEYWDFLHDFANFSTDNGLQRLENYLQQNVNSHLISNSSLEIDSLSAMLQDFRFSPNRSGNSVESDMVQRSADQPHLVDRTNLKKLDPLCSPVKQDTSRRCDEIIINNLKGLQPTVSEHPQEKGIKRAGSQLIRVNEPASEEFTKIPSATEKSTSTLTRPMEIFPANSGVSDGGRSDSNNEWTNNSNSRTIDKSNVGAGSGDVMSLREKDGTENAKSKFKPFPPSATTKTQNTDISTVKDGPQKPFDHMSVDNLYFVNRNDYSTSEYDIVNSPPASTNSNTYPVCSQGGLFLTGPTPTKRDHDVVTAIGDVYINPDKFPAIFRWRTTVLSFSRNVRQKWSTPRRTRSDITKSTNVVTSSNSSFMCSPSPSSGPVKPMFFTPSRDLRRMLYKSITPLHRTHSDEILAGISS